LVEFLPCREGIQGNYLSRWKKHHNHDFLIEILSLTLELLPHVGVQTSSRIQ
jgi:hypothetical protein